MSNESNEQVVIVDVFMWVVSGSPIQKYFKITAITVSSARGMFQISSSIKPCIVACTTDRMEFPPRALHTIYPATSLRSLFNILSSR
eukprot:scaffold11716_cov101-Skeletonema_marinoi.AAC.5